MIDDKFNLIVDTGKKKKALYLDMGTIKNLYKITGKSVFLWVDEFLEADDKKEYIVQILLAMFNGYIDAELLNELLGNKDITNNIIVLINAELGNELVKYKELEEDKLNSIDIDLKDNSNFEVWYNNLYYCAIIEFNKNQNWFYKATPRQIKALDSLYNNNNKNIILNSYSDICKAKNEAREEKEDEDCIVLDEYTSLGDMLTGRG